MSSPFELSYFDPPDRLSRHILASFFFDSEQVEILDRHPGALGQFLIVPEGSGVAHFADHSDHLTPGAYMFCGFSRSIDIEISGPWVNIGASLSPLGWAALTGEPASDHYDRVRPADTLMGREARDFADSVCARFHSGGLSGEEACHELVDWLGKRLSSIVHRHEVVIERTIGWLGSSLNPPVDALFESLGYSRRQGERLVERYFGLPPAALARKFRAVRAAALLSQKNLSDEAEAEIASAFVDQSHMIREIRHFCGYTPSRLGGPSDPIFHVLIRLKNLDRLEQFRAIG